MDKQIDKLVYELYGLTDDEIAYIKNKLTVKPFIHEDFNDIAESFKVFRETKFKLYIPPYFGINNLPWKYEYKFNKGLAAPNLVFNGQLREYQISGIKTILEYYQKQNSNAQASGLLKVGCGWGKTVGALYVASILKLKTLVVVHKDFLIGQWKERIEQFIPTAKIGIIQANKFDIEDKDIVFGMLQSLSLKYYPKDVFADFGFTIYDECHHLGAKMFSNALSLTSTKYQLGLSATPKRKDGLTKVFEWYLGPILYTYKRKINYDVIVKCINFRDPSLKVRTNMYGKVFTPAMITDLVQNDDRNKLIISNLIDLVRENRSILVLSERKDHLKLLKEQVDKQDQSKQIKTGFYIGGLKQKVLKESEKADIIFATMQMANEGLDIKKLNTLVFATPKPDVEQMVGRILRKDKYEENDLLPLIIDIKDNYSIFKRWSKKRLIYYEKSENGYLIEDYNYVKDKGMINISILEEDIINNHQLSNNANICLISDDDET